MKPVSRCRRLSCLHIDDNFLIFQANHHRKVQLLFPNIFGEVLVVRAFVLPPQQTERKIKIYLPPNARRPSSIGHEIILGNITRMPDTFILRFFLIMAAVEGRRPAMRVVAERRRSCKISSLHVSQIERTASLGDLGKAR